MRAGTAFAEIADLVLNGRLHGDSDGVLRDPVFRGVIGFWSEPTLDALYFGLSCRASLREMGATFTVNSQGASESDLRRYYSDFVKSHVDRSSGGVRHSSKGSCPPSLYGCDLLLKTLRLLKGTVRPSAGDQTDSDAQELLVNALGAEGLEKFKAYVKSCESVGGGFREIAEPGLGGVITTHRGLKLLHALGEKPRYADKHAALIGLCWSLGGDGGCSNRVWEEGRWITPSRYCVGLLLLPWPDDPEWQAVREAVVVLLKDRLSALTDFVRRCRDQKQGGFAFEPGQPASVVATWQIAGLYRDIEFAPSLYRAELPSLTELLQECALTPAATRAFLEKQSEATKGGFGWVTGSQPNLYALSAAARLATSAYWHSNADDRSGFDSLVEKMMESLTGFVDKENLFRCYQI